jgi:hypothetical protein
MAQTGYTPILIYSSSTVSQAPSAGNLINSTLGSELAINITDGKLFYKDNANAVQVIAWKTTPTTAGGTGLTSYTAGDLLYYVTGTTLSKLAIGASKTILTSSGTAPQWSTSLDITQGGTGLTTYTAGDLPYYATGTALSKLGIGAANTVLTSSGTVPQWTVQSSLSVGTAANLLSNATTGVMQIVGPGAGTTRVMTIPNANFTAARTDAAQSFTGAQSFGNNINLTDSTAAKVNFATLSSATTNYIQTHSDGYSLMLYVDRGVSKPSYLMSFGGTHQWGFAGTSSMELDVTNKDLTLKDGNLIQGTAAKGVNFTANTGAAGKTSQLLNWYEEGTWTGTLTATTPPTTPVTATGRYTRIGRQVTVNIEFDNKNTTGASGAMSVTGLPFTAGSAGYGPTMKNSMGTNVITAAVFSGNTKVDFSDAADMTNFNIVAATGIYLRFSVTYFV